MTVRISYYMFSEEEKGGKKAQLKLQNIKQFPSVTGIQASSTITVQRKRHCNKEVEHVKAANKNKQNILFIYTCVYKMALKMA